MRRQGLSEQYGEAAAGLQIAENVAALLPGTGSVRDRAGGDSPRRHRGTESGHSHNESGHLAMGRRVPLPSPGDSGSCVRGSRPSLRGSQMSLESSQMSLGLSRMSLGGSRMSLEGSRMSLEGSRTSLEDSRARLGVSYARLESSRARLGGSHARLEDSRARLRFAVPGRKGRGPGFELSDVGVAVGEAGACVARVLPLRSLYDSSFGYHRLMPKKPSTRARIASQANLSPFMCHEDFHNNACIDNYMQFEQLGECYRHSADALVLLTTQDRTTLDAHVYAIRPIPPSSVSASSRTSRPSAFCLSALHPRRGDVACSLSGCGRRRRRTGGVASLHTRLLNGY